MIEHQPRQTQAWGSSRSKNSIIQLEVKALHGNTFFSLKNRKYKKCKLDIIYKKFLLRKSSLIEPNDKKSSKSNCI